MLNDCKYGPILCHVYLVFIEIWLLICASETMTSTNLISGAFNITITRKRLPQPLQNPFGQLLYLVSYLLERTKKSKEGKRWLIPGLPEHFGGRLQFKYKTLIGIRTPKSLFKSLFSAMTHPSQL